jgi:hypothetical protein
VPLAAAGTLRLQDAIYDAPSGTANGHVFARLVDLDPANTYVGGATILEDTCVQGNGATVDLEQETIVVLQTSGATRFDIDHCLIVNGGALEQPYFGGAIEYGAGTQGWVINNTFYNNNPTGVFLHEVVTTADAMIVTLNIFYRNGVAGLVRNDTQPGLAIRYNDSLGNGFEYAMHCGCPSEPYVEIFPGQPQDAPELDATNFSTNPGFVQDPEPPKIPGDFHLSDTSPCAGAGPGGEDLGAFPLGPMPEVVPLTWGGLKARFRD